MSEGALPRPLEGVRILAVEQMQAMPFATQLLAHLGAEVVKVEHPRHGESGRGAQPCVRDDDGREVGATYLRNNLGKKSIGVDLKQPRGIDLLRRLVPHYDVVAENFKPGTMERPSSSASPPRWVTRSGSATRASRRARAGATTSRVSSARRSRPGRTGSASGRRRACWPSRASSRARASTPPTWCATPHVRAHRMVQEVPRPDAGGPLHVAGNPIKLSHSPEPPVRRWPRLGEHTDEILARDLALDAAERAALRADGVIG